MDPFQKRIEQVIGEIRSGGNKAFNEWAQYGVDPESFISLFRWTSDETQEERAGHLSWARGIGLIVPHEYRPMLIGGTKFYQTGPAELHRLINRYHELTGLAFIHDADSGESWLYHSWPHLTLRAIMDQKSYPLENSTHHHPELDKYILPDQ